MTLPLIATKLFIPPPRPKIVLRPRLVERLNTSLNGRLTLISAPAGFGKTTLVSEWIADIKRLVAWVSLDERDDDPSRFLTYVIAALQTIDSNIGKSLSGGLQISQSQPALTESTLTILLNEINQIQENFILVLDDYHVIESRQVDDALAFILKQIPSQMHVVIATREDPDLPLAKMRAQGQLTELRAADLRFTPEESAGFLNQVMSLNLTEDEILTLETRTEGWITGLQLAALSLQGHSDTAGFIKTFSGSHHFVLDYLVEEILDQQSESIQNFLLRSSILDRMCGALCDAVICDELISGQDTLEYMERANLFIIPMDNERHWYRYQHLFADLLRQRLQKRAGSHEGVVQFAQAELHKRASQWYEDYGFEIEAFHHAAAANDIDRAERLVEGKGMPLHFRGAIIPVLRWLDKLPTAVMDTRPSLWVTYAAATMISGNPLAVETKLQSAETGLHYVESDVKRLDLEGQIAGLRSLVASTKNDFDTIMIQSRRALELMKPDNLSLRTGVNFSLGYAYFAKGDRAAASRALVKVLSTGQESGNLMFAIAAATMLGQIQEEENQLHQAFDTYNLILRLVGDPSHMAASEAYFGLARVYYEWNDLDSSEQNCLQAAQLARQIECMTPVPYELLNARIKIARGEIHAAADTLAGISDSNSETIPEDKISEIAEVKILLLLRQGNFSLAAHLAQSHDLPLSLARVHLARGESAEAFKILGSLHKKVQETGNPNELLKILVVDALAINEHGEKDRAIHMLQEALKMAEPSGFIRTFIDEGIPMSRLLTEAADHGKMLDFISRLQKVFEIGGNKANLETSLIRQEHLVDPLSQRELEVLRLIAVGLSNREIGERLYLALSTVKGHSRMIFDKLNVNRRTEAVARARELGLL